MDRYLTTEQKRKYDYHHTNEPIPPSKVMIDFERACSRYIEKCFQEISEIELIINGDKSIKLEFKEETMELRDFLKKRNIAIQNLGER